MQKISDIQHFWKFWSVRLAFVSGAINVTALAIIGAYALLPDDFLPVVHAGFKQAVAYTAMGSAALTAFLAAFSRGIQQPKLQAPSE